jgi:hypothetical protein
MKKSRELRLKPKYCAVALWVTLAFLPLQFAKGAPPVVEIESSSGSNTILKGEPVTLIGHAVDATTGSIPDEHLVWTSDLDGPLGKGASIIVNLSKGSHTVSLTASNASGEVALATITVTVNAP